MSSSMPPFDANIFLENVDYRAIDKGLHLLGKQLNSIKNDLKSLESLSSSLFNGIGSINSIKRPLQDIPILTLPTFPIANYRRKYTRRSNTKYEQNSEFILGQIEALETGLWLSNPYLPIPPHPLPPIDEGLLEEGSGCWRRTLKSYKDDEIKEIPLLCTNNTMTTFQVVLEEKAKMRKEFLDICSTFEGMKAFLRKMSTSPSSPLADKVDVAPQTALSPPPPPQRPFSAPPLTRRASAAAASMQDFPLEDNDIFVPQRSESSQSLQRSNSVTTIRIPSRLPQQQQQQPPPQPEQNERGANYNLPWSRMEIRQLSDLLVHFPEEEVQCRRWAKISAALGTRTPTQVSNRINKMAQKEKKRKQKVIGTGNGNGNDYDYDDDNVAVTGKNTAEDLRREYEGLEKALKILEEKGDDMKCHYGFRCDSCGMEPIIGDRYQCMRCRGVDLCDKCHRDKYPSCKGHPFSKNI